MSYEFKDARDEFESTASAHIYAIRCISNCKEEIESDTLETLQNAIECLKDAISEFESHIDEDEFAYEEPEDEDEE